MDTANRLDPGKPPGNYEGQDRSTESSPQKGQYSWPKTASTCCCTHYGVVTHEAGFRLLPSPSLQGCAIRWPFFCLREDDRNLLPSDLPGAHAPEAFMRVRRDDSGGRACWFSPLPAVSPRASSGGAGGLTRGGAFRRDPRAGD